MSLRSETSVLLSDGGESSLFSVLMDSFTDPVDMRVSSDGIVGWVNENDLIVFMSSVLGNPVRVENSKVSAVSSDSVSAIHLRDLADFYLLIPWLTGFPKTIPLAFGLFLPPDLTLIL